MRNLAAINGGDICYRRGRDFSKILDMGCGDGKRAIALARRTFNCVTGLDAGESLIQRAAQKAAKCGVSVAFRCGDPCATPFEAGTFDEVMLLGDLFGHFPTARSDVDLLREVNRLLKPGGLLHLSFSDGGWVRRRFRADTIEGLPTGFIYRHCMLSNDGHALQTVVIRSNDESGVARRQNMTEWLYTPREVSDLLHRLQFCAITYDDMTGTHSRVRQPGSPPKFVVHCRTGRRSPLLEAISRE